MATTTPSTDEGVAVPPAWMRFLYRNFGWRMEGPYRAWGVADFADDGWMRRQRVSHVLMICTFALLIGGIVWLRLDRVPWFGAGGFIGSLLGPFLFPDRVREQAARRQLFIGSDPSWWSTISNRSAMLINGGVLVLVVGLFIGFLPLFEDDDADRPPVTCARPTPEVTFAVLERFGSSEVYRPTLQVDAPGDAVLVRVGPPVSLYAAVTRRDDATLDVQPVELSAPGIYQQAIDDLDRCS